MKDFSLFYGRSRSWLAVLATLVAALGIALLARSTSDSSQCLQDCGGQQIQADVGARRSSAAFETAPVTAVLGGQGLPSSPWLQSQQSADEVPFVSLQPSPEPMTDAGKAITRRPAAPTPTRPSGDSDREPESEQEPAPDREIPSDCSVQGAPLELMYIAFENYCGSAPRTCSAVGDEWYCEIDRDS